MISVAKIFNSTKHHLPIVNIQFEENIKIIFFIQSLVRTTHLTQGQNSLGHQIGRANS